MKIIKNQINLRISSYLCINSMTYLIKILMRNSNRDKLTE